MCKLFKRKHECVDIPTVLVREKADQDMVKQLEQEILDAVSAMETDNETEQECMDYFEKMSEKELRIFLMEIRGYYMEDGTLDIEAIEEDADDMGTELALQIIGLLGTDRAVEIVDYLNGVANYGKQKELRAAIASVSVILGGSREYVENMQLCRKEAGEIYLEEMMRSLNSIFSVARNRK